MLRATWGTRHRSALRRLAGNRALRLVEHGALAVAGDSLEIATAGDICCVIAGRLAGTALGRRAEWFLARYSEQGLAALTQAEGAYVILISDGERAWIARDRLGAHTVSYSSDGPNVALGEHDADVLELLPATPQPDRLAVIGWMERRSLPEGRSLFSGVRRLPCGQLLALDQRGSNEQRYWQPEYSGVLNVPREEAGNGLRDAAFAAVARGRDDARKPGLRLSGGLDSACVAAGLATTDGPPAHALAATFPRHPEIDETSFVEATAAFSGLPLTKVPFVGGGLLDASLEHLRRWKVPPPSPHLALWRPVWSVARDLGIDVMLDGEGGDETFGSSRYLIADRLRSGRLGQTWDLAGRLPGMGETVSLKARLNIVRAVGVSGALPVGIQALRRRVRPPGHLVSELVRSEDIHDLCEQDDEWGFKRRDGPLWWSDLATDFMRSADAMDVNGFLRRQACDERIEQRHPFLHDVGLVEQVLRTPPEMGFDPVRDRPLLRDALTGHIAEEIRTRHSKSVFTAISVSRMAGEDGRRLIIALSRADAPVREYLSGDGLEKLLDPRPRDSHSTNVRSIRLMTIGLIDAWLLLLREDCSAAANGARSA